LQRRSFCQQKPVAESIEREQNFRPSLMTAGFGEVIKHFFGNFAHLDTGQE
jgi:hypothetical protein